MFYVRPIAREDLPELLTLSERRGAALTTLPANAERLAHRIEAGADAFLMPSRFEPCGMNQMYSQRYGTPPIAHATGGLIDSIVDCDRESLAQGTATGFLFRDMTVPTLLGAVRHALQCYANRDCWRRVQRAGMAADFTWDASARRYLEVYRKALDERSGAAT